tara:strand:+ start:208 stop:1926 length:1719 start_codon:yes stop_codon:yes gene_type:complete
MAQGGKKNKNKNKHNRGGNNPGYGPGSGRGFAGAGIGGNVGGFGKNNTPSGKNNSGQGGKNTFGDKGFGDKGQINFSGLGSFFSNLIGGKAYADAMGQYTGQEALKSKAPPSQAKINRFLKHNIDIANPQPGLKINIDTARAIEGMEDGWKKDWFRKWTPQAIKNLRINHQMYYSPKIKVGDPRYTPQGTGSAKIDPKAEQYLEWMARQNPTGKTVSDMEKIYANNLKDGKHTLEQVMKMNPSNTIPFYALIDDTVQANNEQLKAKAQVKAETKALDTQYKNDQAIYNNNKKNMSVTIGPSTGGGSGPQQQSDSDWLNQQYLSKFGRSADTKTKGGASYWLDQMAKNPTSHSRDEVARMLGASAEAKSFAGDGVVRPGGVRRDQSVYSQGVAGQEYAKHFQPGGALAGQNSADTLNQIAANTYKPMPEIPEGGDGQLQVMPGVDGGYFQFADQDVTPNPVLPGQKIDGPLPKDGWWNQFADADAFKKFLQPDAAETKQDGMGDFMKFMMLMNVMGGGRGGGGGYGGSQYGYGGLNPGGVQAAYNPLEHLQGMGDWFKNNFGSGVQGGTTLTT